MEKRYTVGLYTLGCKVSQYETEAVAEEFEKNGFLRRDFEDECDVYVINTCTVTQESNRKSRQFIRRAIKKNENASEDFEFVFSVMVLVLFRVARVNRSRRK